MERNSKFPKILSFTCNSYWNYNIDGARTTKQTLSGGEADNCSIYALRSSSFSGGKLGTLSTISTQRFPRVATSISFAFALLNLETGTHSFPYLSDDDDEEHAKCLGSDISSFLQQRKNWVGLRGIGGKIGWWSPKLRWNPGRDGSPVKQGTVGSRETALRGIRTRVEDENGEN